MFMFLSYIEQLITVYKGINCSSGLEWTKLFLLLENFIPSKTVISRDGNMFI